MGWARLDDGFHDHPKVDGLSLAAVGLYTLCLTWAHRHRRTAVLPGHITEARVSKLAGKDAHRLVSELLAASLWESETGLGGWVIHDFADYLPKERDPDERREAGRKGAASKWQGHSKPDGNQPGKRDGNLPDASLASDGSRASAPAFPTRTQPNPKNETATEGGDRSETLRASDATEPTCSQHPLGDGGASCGGCRKVREWRERNEQRSKDAAERARTAQLLDEQRKQAAAAVPMPAELRNLARKKAAS